MSRTGVLAALMIAAFIPAAIAQTPAAKPDKAAVRAKKDACQAEAKAKNLTEKASRKAFINECMARK